MAKITEHLTLLEELLRTTFPKVQQHLEKEFGQSACLEIVFWSHLMTIFIVDLMDQHPQIATHIFDIFLIDGEIMIYTLFMKFIENLHDEILTKKDEQLSIYLKNKLPVECLKKVEMYQLFDTFYDE